MILSRNGFALTLFSKTTGSTDKDPDLALSAPFPITKKSFFRKVTRDLLGMTGYRRYSQAILSIFKPVIVPSSPVE